MKTSTKTNRKTPFHPVVITINLMVLLLFGNALNVNSTSHAETPPATTDATTITSVEGTLDNKNLVTGEVCLYELTKYADPEFQNYQTFMEDNFKNKSTTNSLLNLGIQRYEQFKTDIRAKLELQRSNQLQVAGQSGATDASQFEGLSKCEAKAAEYIDNASKLLQMRTATTSSVKKTSLFVEKYKQINSKLKSLDLDIMKMVINVRTFEEKLPCYLKSCI